MYGYNKQILIQVLTNLCKLESENGTVTEEIIDNLVYAGATKEILFDLGYSKDDLEDYVYYVHQVTGESEEEIWESIQ